MDDKLKTKIVTVQRRDTAVPVGVGGDMAGLPRPSTSDCQAEVATEVLDRSQSRPSPFEKGKPTSGSSKLMIDLSKAKAMAASSLAPSPTPPGTPGSGGNVAILDLTWDEDTAKSVKRKRSELGNPEGAHGRVTGERKLGEKINRTIREMDKEIRSMSKVVRENVNTKKEIKEQMTTLRSLMSQLMSISAQELLSKLGCYSEGAVPIGEPACSAATQTTEAAKILKDVAAQTEEGGVRQAEADELTAELNERVNAGYGGFTDIADKRWPPQAFRTVEELVGNPIWEEDEKDTALVTNREDKLATGIGRQFKLRYPELLDVIGPAGEAREGVTYVTYESTSSGTNKKTQRVVYCVMEEAGYG